MTQAVGATSTYDEPIATGGVGEGNGRDQGAIGADAAFRVTEPLQDRRSL